MKKFMKDYAEICKANGKFYKDHWKGMAVAEAAVGVAIFACVCRKDIKKAVKGKFDKKKESK